MIYYRRQFGGHFILSPYMYNYLSDELADIPEKKNEAVNYYLCLSGGVKKQVFLQVQAEGLKTVRIRKEMT